MAYAKLKLYNVTTSTYSATYTIDCNSIKIGFTNNLVAKPNLNGDSVVEVQKQSFENPLYILGGVLLTERSGSLDYDTLLEFAKMDNTSSDNYLVLDVDYGVSSSSILPDTSETKSGIKVVVKSYDITLALDSYVSGSSRIRVGNGSITLMETG